MPVHNCDDHYLTMTDGSGRCGICGRHSSKSEMDAAYYRKQRAEIDRLKAEVDRLVVACADHQRVRENHCAANREAQQECAGLRAEVERLGRLLRSAVGRMDRARGILTNGNPSEQCNWGMLDTSDLQPNAKISGAERPPA
jgi:hypothetical protein